MAFPLRINCFPLPNNSEVFLDVFLKHPKRPGLALEAPAEAILACARYRRVHLNLGSTFWKQN